MIRFTKRAGRFVWRRLSPKFYSRIDKRIDLRLTELDIGWKQHVAAFLNSVSTVKAFGFELVQSREEMGELVTRSQQALREEMSTSQQALREELNAALAATNDIARAAQDRVEFVRREIMYEMRYNTPGAAASADHGGDSVALRSEPRIISADKVATAQREGLRLNLGCGHLPLDGYINVDARDLPGVDVIAEAGNLPFEPGSVREIFSAHMLEHFPQEQLTRRLLPHWRDLLAHDGVFRAITPDGAAMLAGIAQGSYRFDDFREALFGAQEYAGDFHYNMFTPDSLRLLLAEAGFTDIETPVMGRRNGKCFEFEIRATRQA